MSQSAAKKKEIVPRAPRVPSHPERRNYVSFRSSNSHEKNRPAQFCDVSVSGMRLLSRLPAKTQVGDALQLQFSLDGSENEVGTIATSARVVRRMSEYEFAVTFLDSAPIQIRTRESAIKSYLGSLNRSLFAKFTKAMLLWVREHQKGLAIAAASLAVFSIVGTYIYKASDAHSAEQLRPWGKQYPKQWYLDYFKAAEKPE